MQSDILYAASILRRRLDVAQREQAAQREAFEAFTLQQAERVPVWKKMVEDFEADGTKKNPYEMAVRGAEARSWEEGGSVLMRL
jgi:hypothetical protein